MKRQNYLPSSSGFARSSRLPRAPLPYNLPSKRREAGATQASGGIAATGAKWATARPSETDGDNRHLSNTDHDPPTPPKKAWGGAGIRPARSNTEFPNLPNSIVNNTNNNQAPNESNIGLNPSSPAPNRQSYPSSNHASATSTMNQVSSPPSKQSTSTSVPKSTAAVVTLNNNSNTSNNDDDDDDDWADDSHPMDFLSDPVPLTDITIPEDQILNSAPASSHQSIETMASDATVSTSRESQMKLNSPSTERQPPYSTLSPIQHHQLQHPHSFSSPHHEQRTRNQSQFPPPAAHWSLPVRQSTSSSQRSNDSQQSQSSSVLRASPMFVERRTDREPRPVELSEVELKAIQEQSALMKLRAEQAKENRRKEEEERERIRKERAAQKLKELEERLRLKKEQESKAKPIPKPPAPIHLAEAPTDSTFKESRKEISYPQKQIQHQQESKVQRQQQRHVHVHVDQHKRDNATLSQPPLNCPDAIRTPSVSAEQNKASSATQPPRFVLRRPKTNTPSSQPINVPSNRYDNNMNRSNVNNMNNINTDNNNNNNNNNINNSAMTKNYETVHDHRQRNNTNLGAAGSYHRRHRNVQTNDYITNAKHINANLNNSKNNNPYDGRRNQGPSGPGYERNSRSLPVRVQPAPQQGSGDDGPAENEDRDQWLERRRNETEKRDTVQSIIETLLTRAVNGGYNGPKRRHHSYHPYQHHHGQHHNHQNQHQHSHYNHHHHRRGGGVGIVPHRRRGSGPPGVRGSIGVRESHYINNERRFIHGSRRTNDAVSRQGPPPLPSPSSTVNPTQAVLNEGMGESNQNQNPNRDGSEETDDRDKRREVPYHSSSVNTASATSRNISMRGASSSFRGGSMNRMGRGGRYAGHSRRNEVSYRDNSISQSGQARVGQEEKPSNAARDRHNMQSGSVEAMRFTTGNVNGGKDYLTLETVPSGKSPLSTDDSNKKNVVELEPAPIPARPAPWAVNPQMKSTQTMGMSPMAALRAKEEASTSQRGNSIRSAGSQQEKDELQQQITAPTSSKDKPVEASISTPVEISSKSSTKGTGASPPIQPKKDIFPTDSQSLSSSSARGNAKDERPGSNKERQNGSNGAPMRRKRLNLPAAAQNMQDKVQGLRIPMSRSRSMKISSTAHVRSDSSRSSTTKEMHVNSNSMNGNYVRGDHSSSNRGRGTFRHRGNGRTEFSRRDNYHNKETKENNQRSVSLGVGSHKKQIPKTDTTAGSEHQKDTGGFDGNIPQAAIVRDEKVESEAWSNGPAATPSSFDEIQRAFSNQASLGSSNSAIGIIPPYPVVSEISPTRQADEKSSTPYNGKTNPWVEPISDEKPGSELWASKGKEEESAPSAVVKQEKVSTPESDNQEKEKSKDGQNLSELSTKNEQSDKSPAPGRPFLSTDSNRSSRDGFSNHRGRGRRNYRTIRGRGGKRNHIEGNQHHSFSRPQYSRDTLRSSSRVSHRHQKAIDDISPVSNDEVKNEVVTKGAAVQPKEETSEIIIGKGLEKTAAVNKQAKGKEDKPAESVVKVETHQSSPVTQQAVEVPRTTQNGSFENTVKRPDSDASDSVYRGRRNGTAPRGRGRFPGSARGRRRDNTVEVSLKFTARHVGGENNGQNITKEDAGISSESISQKSVEEETRATSQRDNNANGSGRSFFRGRGHSRIHDGRQPFITYGQNRKTRNSTSVGSSPSTSGNLNQNRNVQATKPERSINVQVDKNGSILSTTLPKRTSDSTTRTTTAPKRNNESTAPRMSIQVGSISSADVPNAFLNGLRTNKTVENAVKAATEEQKSEPVPSPLRAPTPVHAPVLASTPSPSNAITKLEQPTKDSKIESTNVIHMRGRGRGRGRFRGRGLRGNGRGRGRGSRGRGSGGRPYHNEEPGSRGNDAPNVNSNVVAAPTS